MLVCHAPRTVGWRYAHGRQQATLSTSSQSNDRTKQTNWLSMMQILVFLEHFMRSWFPFMVAERKLTSVACPSWLLFSYQGHRHCYFPQQRCAFACSQRRSLAAPPNAASERPQFSLMTDSGHEANLKPLKRHDDQTASTLPEHRFHPAPNSVDQAASFHSPSPFAPSPSIALSTLLGPHGSSPSPHVREIQNHSLPQMVPQGQQMQLPSLASIGLPSLAALAARPSAQSALIRGQPAMPSPPSVPHREHPIFTGANTPPPQPSLRRFDTWTKHFEELLHFRNK